MNDKISIIVPVYNVEKYLPQCMDSIISQTYQNLEIILVDDGSTDSCAQICDDYAEKDNRIKVIHKKNGGLSDARNAGYDFVTGDYLSFVDSDDMISKNFYNDLIKIANDHDADIVECGFIKFTDEKKLQNKEDKSDLEIYDAAKALEFLMKEQLKQVVWNKLYKSKVVARLPFEIGKIHEDEFWTYQIFARASKIVKITNLLYYYRQQNQSIMAEQYTIKRLLGMDAREERMKFMTKKFPNLTNLAVQTFWHSAFNNYQAIVRNPHVDVDATYRKMIFEKIKKNVKPVYYNQWKTKDIFWLKFFLAAPILCSRLRNFVEVGV